MLGRERREREREAILLEVSKWKEDTWDCATFTWEQVRD